MCWLSQQSYSTIPIIVLQFFSSWFELRLAILTPSTFSFSKLLLFLIFLPGPNPSWLTLRLLPFSSFGMEYFYSYFHGSFYSIFSILIGTGVLLNPTGTFNNLYGKIIGEFLFQKLVNLKLSSIIIRLWLSYYLHR